MTVKDIIKTTATLLNRQDIIDYINGTYFQEDSDTIKAVEKLNELLNLVINELCLAYVPMVKTEEVAVTNGKIYYNSFSERAVNVLEVLDANQKALGFTLKADHLILPNNASYVKYAYIPLL